jgi:hypothetical protein
VFCRNSGMCFCVFCGCCLYQHGSVRTVHILHFNCHITAHLTRHGTPDTTLHTCHITAHLSHQPLMCFSLSHASLNIARKWPKHLGSLPHVCMSTDMIFTAVWLPPGPAAFTLPHEMLEQQYTYGKGKGKGTLHPTTCQDAPEGE